MKQNKQIERLLNVQRDVNFSGVIFIKEYDGVFEQAFGYANQAEQIRNNPSTRFGIASGAKVFTSAAICRLVEEGKLSFNTRLQQCVDISFPHFHEDITIHHLLTHTSGIPDYFDEEMMDDFSALWDEKPMYSMREGKDFLPMFQHEPMKFHPGERFHYNNAGYIVLGQIVEAVSGRPFDRFVEEEIFQKVGMDKSGYFQLDQLPEQTAHGYIESNQTNQYCIPIKGGADGGVFVTVTDVEMFWRSVDKAELFSEKMTEQFLRPRVHVNDTVFYSYSGYTIEREDSSRKHLLVGYDPGVCFRASFEPSCSRVVVVCSNQSEGADEMIEAIG
ncbi:serine hydrolase domain-containing protein [Geomicrobium sp. JSM 1781026]